MSQSIVNQAAALRGQGDFRKAIEVVDHNRAQLDEITRLPALLQAFYAARDAGLSDEATRLARDIATEDPNVPMIQNYLD